MRTKDGWRRWAGTLGPVPHDVAFAVNRHLESFLRSRSGPVLGYSALSDEVPLLVEIDALPRLSALGSMTIHRDVGERVVHQLAFEEPPPDAPQLRPTDVAVVLVPGRVFDREGYRLGRGGGHYDRMLPSIGPDTPVIGVTCEARIVDRLPREPHDRAMTHLVSEDGLFSTK